MPQDNPFQKAIPSTGTLPVLVAAPRQADAAVLKNVLAQGGFDIVICDGVHGLCEQIPSAATAVIGEEMLTSEAQRLLTEVLAAQPEWSDFPLIVMTAADEPYPETRRLFESIEGCAHPVLLQRPMRRYTLLSTVRAALRARARQHQVRDELAQRRRAEQALRDTDRRKDEFLATLGHELRNPLAAVSSALDITGMTDDPEELAKAHGIMRRQVTQLTRLVDDLLEVSRITRGKLELERRPVELATIVQCAVEDVADAISEGGHELTVDLPPDPILLHADPVRLGQVLANLLSNAARYTPHGGRIALTAGRDAGGVRLSIKDTGIGLASETIETIFEMFEQVGDAGGAANQGLGIGLSLVKSLVELHGGAIEVHSEGLDRGSEFIVWLPLADGARASRSPQTSMGGEEAEQTTPCRVLLAEDNEDAATTLAALVELLGHEIRVVYDGEAALAAAAEFDPDLVLLDLGLPKLTGYDVARRLRAGPRGDAPVLAAVTGWSQASHRERAGEAGFDLHLTKPLTLETLRSLLAIVATQGAREQIGARLGPASARAPPPLDDSRRHTGE